MRDLAAILAIVLLALALRLTYLAQLRDSPFFARHVMDPLYHHQWAEAFAAGREAEFVPGAYFRAPLYPWLLGTIYWLFGADPWTPRVVGAVIGSLSCALLYLIGRAAFDRAVGLTAGLAAAGYPMLLYFDAELKTEGLSIFLNLLLLYVLLSMSGGNGTWRWAVAGVLLGLSAITRPTVLILAPAAVAWAFWLSGRAWRRGAGRSLLLFAGTMLPIVPVTVRNYIVGQDLALIATSGGVNFYIGNNPGSDGMSAVIPGDPPAWWPCYHAQIERAERAVGRRLRGSEVSRWYAAQAWEWISRHPWDALRHTLRKLGYFWSHWEVSNNQDIRFVFTRYARITQFLPIRFWLVAPLGVLGLLLSLRQPRRLAPLWGFVLLYMLAVVAFFVTARYRIPVVVVLILLAAHAAWWLARQIAALRWRPLLAAAATLSAMGFVCARTPPGLDTHMIQGHVAAGMFLAADNQYDQAEPLLAEAVRRAQETGWRLQPDVPAMLGRIRAQRGDFAAAAEALRYAATLAPQDIAIRRALGMALAGLEQFDAAAAEFRAVLSLAPDDLAAQANLGAALVRSTSMEEGIEHLAAAVRGDARYARILAEAAEWFVRRGKLRPALRLLEAGRQAAPDSLAILTPLIQLRLSMEDQDIDATETLRLAEQALEAGGRQDALASYAAAQAYAAAGDVRRARELGREALRLARQSRQRAVALEAERLLRRLERSNP